MPIPFILPKLKDDDVFEDLCRDLYSRISGDINIQRYGKKGQKQFGVDSAGIAGDKVIGIQSKNHSDPKSKITVSEINAEIVKAETFLPKLQEYYIFTSSDRDTKTHSHVLSISKERSKLNNFPVYIKFWEDIVEELTRYPDLLVNYFVNYFPTKEAENIINFTFDRNRKTFPWPLAKVDVQKLIDSNLDGLKRQDPYKFSVAFNSFPEIDYSGKVDLQINIPTNGGGDVFKEALKELTKLRDIVGLPVISKDLTIFTQTRINLAFLIGWYFRQIAGYKLTLIVRDDVVWRTFGLPLVEHKLIEEMPVFLNDKSDDYYLVLSISRDIQKSVLEYAVSQETKPKVVIGYSLESGAIESAAQALAISRYLSKKIKNINDKWGSKRIHLFSAMPTALATLIAYQLNAICPISLYYRDEARENYKFGDEINNSI